MTNSDNNDIFGLKPIGETVKVITERTYDGIGAFLSRVCLPASEEFGLMIRDKIRSWRLRNIDNMLKKAEGKLDYVNDDIQLKAHPRVAMSIIENASYIDDECLQEWWAGLFASSCTDGGIDDQNLIFSNLLRQLTVFEVKLLTFCCENCIKNRYPSGLIIVTDKLELSVSEIKQITSVDDLYRIDRELDHLVSLGLLSSRLFNPSGFIADETVEKDIKACLIPSALCLNLYYKANAVNISQEKFWGDKLVDVLIRGYDDPNDNPIK